MFMMIVLFWSVSSKQALLLPQYHGWLYRTQYAQSSGVISQQSALAAALAGTQRLLLTPVTAIVQTPMMG